MENIFDINKFNIIEDEENYYFFRALNMADVHDIETNVTIGKTGEIERIRTDRERYEEDPEKGTPKYIKASKMSLGQIYDHIKMHNRKDTNCISLSSNANVSIAYGRGFYQDKYVLVKIPKKEFGERTVNAGQYMLEEVKKKVEEYISSIKIDSKIQEAIDKIDKAETEDELRNVIERRYTSKGKIDLKKSRMKQGIRYKEPCARISKYQALNEEQSLEKNRIIAKLTLLERTCGMPPVISNTGNNNLLIETIGNAFSSLEVIHYGDIERETIIELPKEIVEVFALMQQVDVENNKDIDELKREVIRFLSEGKKIKIEEESNLDRNNRAKEDITIDEMYELTRGKVEYGMANSIVKNMFYLSRAQLNARKLAQMLRQITGNNPKYDEIISYISKNGFAIEPEIITRKSNRGVKISESVNLDLKPQEIDLVDKIKGLSSQELIEVLKNGGLSNVQDIISSTFAKVQRESSINKEEYYAEAIIESYNWKKIGIEEFTIEEKNNLIKRLKNEYLVELYRKLEAQGIERKDIPKILLNIVTRNNDFEITENDNQETIKANRIKQYDRLIKENSSELNQDLSIGRIERFLGYYDVEGTKIQLRSYQQRAVDNTNEIYKDKRFASIILPTGGGKSFVTLAELMEHKNERILYLAPQNEIIEQMKDYIIKYIHGPVNTLGRSKDEIVSDVFPNLTFATYPELLSERGKEIINKEYDFIVLDELHRTGATEWRGKLDTLLENQPENTKVLGITATPRRDVDGINMAKEMAEMLGYTNKEAVSGKHIAMNISLPNATRMGLVVNTKIISCAYNLKTDGSLDKLKESINQIEDIQKRNEETEKYENLRRSIEEAEGIPEILQANVKKGGKYIVFLPIIDQIEDDDGNVIGTKRGKEKIEKYEKLLAEYFKGSDITPNFHSMLGEYGDKENSRRLAEFQNRNTEDTEFMLVMNKANEGLHLDKLDGIIWLRPMDENSRILYLQQLGRIIYSEDPDNPTKDEDRPIAIDLVNNTIKVNWEDEITEQDDIQMLNIIIDWAESHDGILPNINSIDKEEAGYAGVLKEIQTKYKGYLKEGFDDLNQKQTEEIQEILRLGSLIDLWEIELPEKLTKDKKTNGRSIIDKKVGPFEVTGLLRNFVDLKNEVNGVIIRSVWLKNAIEIEKWCEINYGDKKIWERSLPKTNSIDEYEKKLGKNLSYIRHSIMKKYEGKALEEIEDEEDRKTVEIIRGLDKEYGLGVLLKNALEIEKWCERNYGDKKKWERRLPTSTAKDEYEKKLGIKLATIRQNIMKKYEGKRLEEIEGEEDRQTVEIIRGLDKEYGLGTPLKNALEIKDWCESNYGDKKIWDRRLPTSTAKDEYEKKLGINLSRIRQNIIKKYEGKALEEIEDEEDRKTVEIIRGLDKEYGLGDYLKNALEIEEWCRKYYEEKKIWEKNLPNRYSTDEYEKKLAIKLATIRQNIMKMYTGMRLEEIEGEEDRQIVEIIRGLDKEYGLGALLKSALEIKYWCESNYRDKKIWERGLPKTNPTDEYEKKLASKLSKIRYNIIKKYEGKKLEEIENEEDRQVVEIIRRLDEEYGRKKKITGQDIGMSSFDASVEECDKVQQVLTILIETTKEGEITQND